MDYVPFSRVWAASATDNADISSAERADVDTFLNVPLELEEMTDQTQQPQRQADPIQECPLMSPQASIRGVGAPSTQAIRTRPNTPGRGLDTILPRPRPVGSPQLQLDDYPGGYPRVAYLMKSDSDLAYYRRFGYLHSRLLLYKQDQLRELEEELLICDRVDDACPERQCYLYCRGDDDDRQSLGDSRRTRKQLLKEIEQLLLEYGSILKQAQNLWATDAPSVRHRAALVNYFDNYEPLVAMDAGWLRNQDDDLIHIGPTTETDRMDSVVQEALVRGPSWLKRPFTNQQESTNPNIHYFAVSRIKFVSGILLTTMISLLLTIPVLILWTMSTYIDGGVNIPATMSVILACTLVLNLVLGNFTKAKRHEIIAASAGYTAVLVVFIGNSNNGSGTTS